MAEFAKTYEDSRGWLYRVMTGVGESNYKARYRKPGTCSWKCCRTLPWQRTAEAAQTDLDKMAARKRFFCREEDNP